MPKAKTLQMKDIQTVGSNPRRKSVRNFQELVPPASAYRLDEMIDQTIYIIKLEEKPGTQYGDGFIVTFKDLPNAAEICNAGVFGQFPVKQLQALYAATVQGSEISLTSPVKTTIRQAGKSYKFE